MSRNFDLATGPNYSINSVGSLGSLGNGAYTIIALFNINTGNNNCGLISFRTAGINAELFIDGNQIFGQNDFNGGQTGVTVSTWWWAAIRKAAGTNVYRYSLRQYNTGSTTHQNSVATHADSGATNTTIRLGDTDDRSNGLVAVLAAWTSNLSDGQVAGMFTTAASDVVAQSPGGLWLGNQASSSDPMNDSAGTANQTSVNGAIGVGADPPSYNYSLSGATGIWLPMARARVRTQPPRRRPRAFTPTRAQVNPPYPFAGIKQPRQLRGLFTHRAHASGPVPAQIIVTPPAYPPRLTRARLRGLFPRRSRITAPVPAQQTVTPAGYPPAPVRVRLRGLRLFRARLSGVPPEQSVPPAPPRSRTKASRLFRSRIAIVPQAQIVVTPPPYPPQPTRTRLRGLRLFRLRAATPAPAQATAPVAPAFVPPSARTRLRFGRLFRGRAAAPITPQSTPASVPHRRESALPRLQDRRPRSFGAAPPQIVIIPPAYPPRPARSRLRGLKRFFGRGAMPVPPQQEVVPPVVPPITPPVTTGDWWSLVSVERENRTIAEQRQPTACPNDGEPLRLSADGYWFCTYDGYRLGDVPVRRHVQGQDWGGLTGLINSVIADSTEDIGRRVLACPNDGEPLSRAADGTLFCEFDGWRPDQHRS